MKTILTSLAAGALLLLSACEVTEPGPGTDSGNPQSGYVTGKVTGAGGKALSGINVFFDNTLYYNSGFSATTDAAGNYKVKAQPGAFRGYARMSHRYNGQTYRIDLHPDKYDSFGEEGAVRNFSWRLTGERPSNPDTFYGGTAYLYANADSEVYDVENIEFTFTPVGPLIDGSTGKTLVRKSGAPRTKLYAKIVDIPIGRYKITAVHKPTGRRLRLQASYDQPLAESLTQDFYGDDSPTFCNDCMRIEYAH
ncbi:carboxypeptidase-like regulatory domain-containing protein [Tellurirhabdus rosea]|uniref:carboxypeptidase-like regulatory domain-containing protein n=1 Tax=Tellurirhabdus rosea TaxID=2674997 RepID=UPI002252D8D2|nr:carboxypeptidase-like regulatory domain-containing protein [Tellurirhabdus rosea]